MPSAESYREGDKVTLKPSSTFVRENYTFTSWSDGAATYQAGATFTMPAHNVTFTAQWEELPPVDNSTDVTASEVKFDGANLVFKGKAGGGVKTLTAYLYDANEKTDTYKATATIGADRSFTVNIGLAQLTSAPGNWYYLMISVNGGAMEKVEYKGYNAAEKYTYGNREYKWEYYEGIAVSYSNVQTKSLDIDMSGTSVRAGKDGRVYLTVSGTFSGYAADAFDLDVQLQAGEYTKYKNPVTTALDGNTYRVKTDISDLPANKDGEYYSIHLFVDGNSHDVASNNNPYIIETSATDDDKIYRLKSDKAWWSNSTYIMQISVESAPSRFSQSDYLKVDGASVKKNYGSGEEVMLRGTNAGGYLVTEEWMTVIGYKDYKTASDILTARFGKETMRDLWAYYQSYFWSDRDFANCADMGMTAIRLPFTYMNVDIDGEYDFSVLDDFVRGAAKYGIYTIIDLHGAYGSQNGQDHSGEVIDDEGDVDFYQNQENKAKTVKLWKALSEHYRDNPAVAAFDILNEPGIKGGWTNKTQWDFYDELYDAIREGDGNRIVIFESCWTGDSLPRPSEYGWENCMYSFHHYVGDEGDFETLKSKMNERIDDLKNKNFGVPLYMGEFTCYGNEDFWKYTLQLFADNGWHWTSWTYKVNYKMGGWGIYYTSARKGELNLNKTSVYDIKDIFRGVSTSWAQKTDFNSGTLLYDIIKNALK